MPYATNTQYATDCVALVGVAALRAEKTGDSHEVCSQVWQWIRDVELPEIQKDPDNALRLNLVKMHVALAAKDFRAAAELAPRCGRRVMQPMWLALGGQREEAYDAQKNLRQDATLTAPERVGLRKLEPLILMFAERFEEAWKAIDEQRQSPKLNAEGSKWLDTIEGILRNYETAIRNRQNGKP